MKVLEKEKLLGNLKKCTFFSYEVTFLWYMVPSVWVKANWRPFGLGPLLRAFMM